MFRKYRGVSLPAPTTSKHTTGETQRGKGLFLKCSSVLFHSPVDRESSARVLLLQGCVPDQPRSSVCVLTSP